jgi:hypothetical protein
MSRYKKRTVKIEMVMVGPAHVCAQIISTDKIPVILWRSRAVPRDLARHARAAAEAELGGAK